MMHLTSLYFDPNVEPTYMNTFKCRVCGKDRALAMIYDNGQYGPYCKEHWIDKIKEEFANYNFEDALMRGY